jgi:hypothetical protein
MYWVLELIGLVVFVFGLCRNFLFLPIKKQVLSLNVKLSRKQIIFQSFHTALLVIMGIKGNSQKQNVIPLSPFSKHYVILLTFFKDNACVWKRLNNIKVPQQQNKYDL